MIPKDDLEAQTVTIAALGDIKVTKSKDEMISDAEAEKLAKNDRQDPLGPYRNYWQQHWLPSLYHQCPHCEDMTTNLNRFAQFPQTPH